MILKYIKKTTLFFSEVDTSNSSLSKIYWGISKKSGNEKQEEEIK